MSAPPRSPQVLRVPHVLALEDDESLRVVLVDNLESEGYAVTPARSIAEARRALELASYDLVILDLMLPDGDGYTLARELRRAQRPERILMLTARTLEDDVVRGFEAGADDYVVKPYRRRELLARVAALSRRAAPTERNTLTFADFTLDLDARTLHDAAGRDIVLTRTELDLLATFVTHRGIVRTRDQLLDAAWGQGVMVDERTVDNFVLALKKKLGWTREAGWRFVAVRGVGYRFEVDP
ncbi:MAG: response regulator transcription factor [Deltaproteobacteria bacterium]|nr:response regulator transcription factor [Deltaproteobacteria bacterium]